MHILFIMFSGEEQPVNPSGDAGLLSLVSSWWSSFGVAFSAVYWSASVGFEWDFAFLSAFSANCLMHFFSIGDSVQLLMFFSARIIFFARLPIFSPILLNISVHNNEFYAHLKEYQSHNLLNRNLKA
jgi:hypothetical protein